MIWLSHIYTKEEKEMIYDKALDKICTEPTFDTESSSKAADTINLIKETFPTKIQTSMRE